MSKAISCTVKSNIQAEKILDDLLAVGFSNKNVSILFPDRIDTKKWIQSKLEAAPGVLGWLVGVGILAIPGIGPFIVAGPLLKALNGSVAGIAMGHVTTALIGLGMPEYESKIYENKIKEGLILISAHTQEMKQEKRDEARRIFKNAEANDISECDEVAE